MLLQHNAAPRDEGSRTAAPPTPRTSFYATEERNATKFSGLFSSNATSQRERSQFSVIYIPCQKPCLIHSTSLSNQLLISGKHPKRKRHHSWLRLIASLLTWKIQLAPAAPPYLSTTLVVVRIFSYIQSFNTYCRWPNDVFNPQTQVLLILQRVLFLLSFLTACYQLSLCIGLYLECKHVFF
jgi:hypothetical protein